MARIAAFPALTFAGANSRSLAAVRFSTMAAALLLSSAAVADPIELKLAFFGSEATNTYHSGVKPFVDGVNAEGKGLVTIKVYADGGLGRVLAEQPRMVLDGTTDIAWIIPGQTPYRFPDNELIEQPGMFRSTREGTLVYTRLIAAKALRGYDDFFVIGAFTTAPSFIHSRKPVGSLAALKGQKIRANNATEAEVLERLGAWPTVMEPPKLANAIRSGAIDGVAMNPTGPFDYGVSQIATNHYLLRSGATPLTLVMNRKKFDGLPEAVRMLIRKYSGEGAAAAWIEFYGRAESERLDKTKADPARTVVEPSPADLATAQRVYRSMIDAWAAKSPHNRDLLKMVEAELATIRSTGR